MRGRGRFGGGRGRGAHLAPQERGWNNETYDEDEIHDDMDNEEQRQRDNYHHHGNQGRYFGGGRNREDDDGIKLKIPSFQGKSDPEAYLEWEKRVDMVFDCKNYSEAKKVKLAAIEFTEYAIVWWDKLVSSRRKVGDRPVETWDEMKAIMRRKFIPSHYQRDLHQKLQRLNQGSRSVDEYYKDLEITMIRANIDEDEEATMARFIGGLNKDIANIVELQTYMEIEELVDKAMKIERQLRVAKFSRGNTSSTSYTKQPWNKQDGGEKYKSEPPKSFKADSSKGKEAMASNNSKGKIDNPSSKDNNIKCFKCLGRRHMAKECPNKKVMFINDYGDYDCESDEGAQKGTR